MMDYYPYGSIRLNQKNGTLDEKRKFIGEQFDDATQLSYLNARYYDGGRGGFLSEDPVFINLGVDRRTEQVLQDPQLMNSYNYGRNNPLKYVDPDGKMVLETVFGVVLTAYGIINLGIDLYNLKTVAHDYPDQFSREEKVNAAGHVGLDALFVGVGYSPTLSESRSLLLDMLTTSFDVADHSIGEEMYENANKRKKDSLDGYHKSADSQNNQSIKSKVFNVTNTMSADNLLNSDQNSSTNTDIWSASQSSKGYFLNTDIGRQYCFAYQCDLVPEKK